MQKEKRSSYRGFEQGPIRPPSEAESLLVRITRNCPWNRCTFCPVYKEKRFSLRPPVDVIRDIDAIHQYISVIRDTTEKEKPMSRPAMRRLFDRSNIKDPAAFQSAVMWASHGMRSIFLQDANSLIIKPDDMITILRHLKHRFPWVDRITSYARSHTIARISDEHLATMKDAGLNRIHIGLESGSDLVLERAAKGVTKEMHIMAGIKVKTAGMELSEYVMPGLGGRDLSAIHASETADAVNRINPDFIRLRTLAIPGHVKLYEELKSGTFEKCTDLETAEEILSFIRQIDGITGKLRSDHILNLFQEIEGTFPEDKEAMVNILEDFLALPPRTRSLYQVGRRMGIFSGLKDMENLHLRHEAENVFRELGVTPENVDELTDNLMKRFI